MTRARTILGTFFELFVTLGLGILLAGCLNQRLTAAQVIQNAQQALGEMGACHTLLHAEISTDMFQDSLVVEMWEKQPDRFKLLVQSANSPQLNKMAFTTDGAKSISYSPHTNTATIGPIDVVRMPQVLVEISRARRKWIQNADLQAAKLEARVRENGLMVYKINIPTGQGGYIQYSIDVQQWWVRQVVYKDDYLGSGVISLDSIDCSDDIEDAVFDLDIPDGAAFDQIQIQENRELDFDEAQTKVGFRLRKPQYVPPGTDFGVAYQLDKNIALIYTGEHPFTLVQGPYIGTVPQEDVTLVPLRGRQATLIQDQERDGLVLIWREDDLQFSIASSLNLNEILQIAESIE